MMVDIAHASHHLDYLQKAEATNTLLRGLKVEPRMMLVSEDKATSQEWAKKDQEKHPAGLHAGGNVPLRKDHQKQNENNLRNTN